MSTLRHICWDIRQEFRSLSLRCFQTLFRSAWYCSQKRDSWGKIQLPMVLIERWTQQYTPCDISLCRKRHQIVRGYRLFSKQRICYNMAERSQTTVHKIWLSSQVVMQYCGCNQAVFQSIPIVFLGYSLQINELIQEFIFSNSILVRNTNV